LPGYGVYVANRRITGVKNSKTCRCGNRMVFGKPEKKNYHLMTCRRCGFTDDRDHIAVHNIAWKFHRKLTAPG